VLELESGLEFTPDRDAEFFALLPAKPAVCLIRSREASAEPYLIRTADLRRARLNAHKLLERQAMKERVSSAAKSVTPGDSANPATT
jgi:hypothetical protein